MLKWRLIFVLSPDEDMPRHQPPLPTVTTSGPAVTQHQFSHVFSRHHTSAEKPGQMGKTVTVKAVCRSDIQGQKGGAGKVKFTHVFFLSFRRCISDFQSQYSTSEMAEWLKRKWEITSPWTTAGKGGKWWKEPQHTYHNQKVFQNILVPLYFISGLVGTQGPVSSVLVQKHSSEYGTSGAPPTRQRAPIKAATTRISRGPSVQTIHTTPVKVVHWNLR